MRLYTTYLMWTWISGPKHMDSTNKAGVHYIKFPTPNKVELREVSDSKYDYI